MTVTTMPPADEKEMPREIFVVIGDKNLAGMWSLSQINLQRQKMGKLTKNLRADLASQADVEYERDANYRALVGRTNENKALRKSRAETLEVLKSVRDALKYYSQMPNHMSSQVGTFNILIWSSEKATEQLAALEKLIGDR